jgi:hypothetical protein
MASHASTGFTPTVPRTARVAGHSLAGARRAVIRARAAAVTRDMIRELVATPGIPAHPNRPAHLRLDALCERYRALGGDSADLLR